MIAVGFSPWLARQGWPCRVATFEASQTSLRDGAALHFIRGLKPTATIVRPEGRGHSRLITQPPQVALPCHFVHSSDMATKTIALELDAYEKLRTARKAGESLSEVVRRASFADAPLTGESLRAYLRAGGGGVSERYLDAVDQRALSSPCREA